MMIYLGADGGIPEVSKEEIIGRAEAVLKKCRLDNEILVDIETVCDALCVNILPVADLFRCFHIDAFISADFRTIYVDEGEFRKSSPRYRFSVAHELGHFVLHRDYYPSGVSGLREWVDASCDLLSAWAENQANCFAGNLLVPEDKLIQILNNEFGGSFARNYWNASPAEFECIFARVGKKFMVSEQVILRRMQDIFPGVGRDIYYIVNNNWRSYVNKK